MTDDVEIPTAVSDSVASWQHIFAARADHVDAHDLLRNAAAELFPILDINRTAYPESDAVARQFTVDALQQMAESAGIEPDNAQQIFADAKEVKKSKPALGDARASMLAGAAIPALGSASKLRIKLFPPINYVVPRFIVQGCTLLGGKPKIGKSWLCLDAGVAVARGGHCWGGIKCPEGDVLYLALEDNERRLQDRITRILATRPNGLLVLNTRPSGRVVSKVSLISITGFVPNKTRAW
jgi:hypothetical protein